MAAFFIKHEKFNEGMLHPIIARKAINVAAFFIKHEKFNEGMLHPITARKAIII